MNKQIIQDLIDLNIFKSKAIAEKEYMQAINKEKDSRYLYRENINSEGRKWYEQVDMNNLSDQEIKMLLNTSKAKDIHTIKNAAIFFVALSIMSMVMSIINAVYVAKLL